ncbi:MAG: HAMP domain-containing histidine kinase [Colwellia sp.]|nr:HAMP domain-containing histidine kinase [Colwellia sp.]
MLNKNLNTHQQILRFRKIVFIFFICLTLPLAMVVYYGFQKFENEMLFQYRWKSANVVTQINKVITKRITKEQQRSPLDYYYYRNIENEESQNISPLSYQRQPHYQTDLFGLVGFFNIVDKKKLNTPILPFTQKRGIIRTDQTPTNLQLNSNDIDRRITKIKQLKKILGENGFLQTGNKNNHFSQRELSTSTQPIETQVGSFKLMITKNQQFVFYRNASINQQISVQGFVVNRKEFLEQLFSDYIRFARYDNAVQVQMVNTLNKPELQYYQYNINEEGDAGVKISTEENRDLLSQSLFKGELIEPFANISLQFTTGDLPLGPATSFVFIFIVVLSLVIVAGSIGFYWLGVKQIALAEQRMNFVSAVSHELKTPLTSILMYSEMLKSGMVPDQKNQQDYHHFIFDESERLSRLINNVLQLSNLSRNQEVVTPEYVSIDVLKDIIQSKVSTLIAKNNFQLNFIVDKNSSSDIQAFIDLDAFAQIIINLIDNSVKFYNAAKINEPQRQKIDISFAHHKNAKDKLNFSIRDYGPGISHSQHEKIFDLFYRCGNEMTRTTSGTGIGLALVHQLVIAQGGEINVTRHQQGVSFDLSFSILQS